MMKRLTILCISTLLLASMFGCEPKTRYRALCILFDGVPTPPGMVPCDADGRYLASQTVSSQTNGQDVARAYTQHGPYAARLCEGCHQRQSNRLLMAKEDLCFNCHDLSIKKRIVHGPVASGSCVICHDPHGSGNKYLLVSKSQDFCLYCHNKEDILKTDAHKNNMDTGCTTCHNAHASDNDFLLISLAAESYKAKRQTPPRASGPRKERASGNTKQVPPTTSSELGPEKRGVKFPTSSATPPLSPGADLKQKHISQRAPATQSARRQVDLVEANRDR